MPTFGAGELNAQSIWRATDIEFKFWEIHSVRNLSAVTERAFWGRRTH